VCERLAGLDGGVNFECAIPDAAPPERIVVASAGMQNRTPARWPQAAASPPWRQSRPASK
jgi:hypothetical protein